MQSTLAFAPTDDDFDEAYFDVPVLSMMPIESRVEDPVPPAAACA